MIPAEQIEKNARSEDRPTVIEKLASGSSSQLVINTEPALSGKIY